ncbi:MAG TPA: hypothetical protein VND21_05240 [Planctomycetota bacterium]|nr:hypothetical protein [Planctomycetota bacterium]
MMRSPPPTAVDEGPDAPTIARLRVMPRTGGLGFDLRLGGEAGPVVATISPAPHLVILDAVLHRGADGDDVVVASEFDVALQRGRVVRWSFDGPGGPVAALPLFEGPPGSVLWWLRERAGQLEVRDIRHGCTHPLESQLTVPR